VISASDNCPDDETVGIHSPTSPGDAAEEATLGLHAERIDVTKEAKVVGIVRASTVTELRAHEVIEELAEEYVEIVHVPIGRQIEFCPPVRVEGDTTILSIVEEIVVVERRLVLKEEVHMTKVRTTHAHRETVLLREQHAVITREQTE
jgi:stress response protein YsnF